MYLTVTNTVEHNEIVNGLLRLCKDKKSVLGIRMTMDKLFNQQYECQ